LAKSILPSLLRFAGYLGEALAGLGARTQAGFQAVSYWVGVLVGCLVLAFRPSSWPRTVRDVLVRQLLFTGVETTPFAIRIAIAVGIMVVVEGQLLSKNFGASDMLSPIFLNVIVRELGPLLANFVIIVRSSTAIATELANMKLLGEVEVLDSQGLDPMKYLVLPRVVGVSISSFCVGVIFVVTVFGTGYVVGTLMGSITGGPGPFFTSLFDAAGLIEVTFFLPKTILAGFLIGVISCTEGLRVRRALTEVPQAASRAAVRSLTAVFGLSALLSLFIYGRILIFEVL
jgi:phospholipid/cholesterol/gamma-HCH transport system permease protein